MIKHVYYGYSIFMSLVFVALMTIPAPVTTPETMALCRKCGPKINSDALDYMRKNQPGAAWRFAADTPPPPLIHRSMA